MGRPIETNGGLSTIVYSQCVVVALLRGLSTGALLPDASRPRSACCCHTECAIFVQCG